MRSSIAFALGAAVLLASCNQTKFVSTWTEPGRSGPVELPGKKVAAFLLTHKKNLREATEDLLARSLTERGAQGIAGYTLINEDGGLDSTQALEALRSNGVDGAVILRPVGNFKESDVVPGQVWYTSGYYSSFSGYWGYGWPGAYDPGEGVTNKVYAVETMVYSVKDNRLLWSGISHTTQPADLEKFIAGLSEAASKEMKKSGLLPK
jgi:hypothetical protein